MSRCNLCDGASPSQQHCESASHIAKVTQLLEIRRGRLEVLHDLRNLHLNAQKEEEKIGQLIWEPWKDILRAKLFPHNLWNLGEDGKEGLPAKLPSIDMLLRKYLHWERLSLLELAAWKSFILLCFHDPSAGVFESLDFFKDGWKVHKKEVPRQSIPGLAIILTHVKEFLGEP